MTSISGIEYPAPIEDLPIFLSSVFIVAGDTLLNTPNVWRNTNQFNAFLPTSTQTPTTSNQLITKAYGDANYVSGPSLLGGNNVWTGTNSFNVHLPTSNSTPTTDTQLITKVFADTTYGGLTSNNVWTGTSNSFTSGSNSSVVSPTLLSTSNGTFGISLSANSFIGTGLASSLSLKYLSLLPIQNQTGFIDTSNFVISNKLTINQNPTGTPSNTSIRLNSATSGGLGLSYFDDMYSPFTIGGNGGALIVSGGGAKTDLQINYGDLSFNTIGSSINGLGTLHLTNGSNATNVLNSYNININDTRPNSLIARNFTTELGATGTLNIPPQLLLQDNLTGNHLSAKNNIIYINGDSNSNAIIIDNGSNVIGSGVVGMALMDGTFTVNLTTQYLTIQTSGNSSVLETQRLIFDTGVNQINIDNSTSIIQIITDVYIPITLDGLASTITVTDNTNILTLASNNITMTDGTNTSIVKPDQIILHRNNVGDDMSLEVDVIKLDANNIEITLTDSVSTLILSPYGYTSTDYTTYKMFLNLSTIFVRNMAEDYLPILIDGTTSTITITITDNISSLVSTPTLMYMTNPDTGGDFNTVELSNGINIENTPYLQIKDANTLDSGKLYASGAIWYNHSADINSIAIYSGGIDAANTSILLSNNQTTTNIEAGKIDLSSLRIENPFSQQSCIFMGSPNGYSPADPDLKNTIIGIATATVENFIASSNNVALGFQSLSGVNGGQSANNNIAIGVSALANLYAGNNNIALGVNACVENQTGDNNINIGFQCSTSEGGKNQVLIGYEAGLSLTTDTNPIGDNIICIGHTSTPSSSSASNEFTLGNGYISVLRCNTTTITSISDARDKKDIQDLEIGLDFINTVRPVSFTWDIRDCNTNKNGKREAGFIAQELDTAQQNANVDWLELIYKSNPDRLEASSMKLFPILIKAVQELSQKVKVQEERITQLESISIRSIRSIRSINPATKMY